MPPPGESEELDDFGLPIKRRPIVQYSDSESDLEDEDSPLAAPPAASTASSITTTTTSPPPATTLTSSTPLNSPIPTPIPPPLRPSTSTHSLRPSTSTSSLRPSPTPSRTTSPANTPAPGPANKLTVAARIAALNTRSTNERPLLVPTTIQSTALGLSVGRRPSHTSEDGRIHLEEFREVLKGLNEIEAVRKQGVKVAEEVVVGEVKKSEREVRTEGVDGKVGLKVKAAEEKAGEAGRKGSVVDLGKRPGTAVSISRPGTAMQGVSTPGTGWGVGFKEMDWGAKEEKKEEKPDTEERGHEARIDTPGVTLVEETVEKAEPAPVKKVEEPKPKEEPKVETLPAPKPTPEEKTPEPSQSIPPKPASPEPTPIEVPVTTKKEEPATSHETPVVEPVVESKPAEIKVEENAPEAPVVEDKKPDVPVEAEMKKEPVKEDQKPKKSEDLIFRPIHTVKTVETPRSGSPILTTPKRVETPQQVNVEKKMEDDDIFSYFSTGDSVLDKGLGEKKDVESPVDPSKPYLGYIKSESVKGPPKLETQKKEVKHQRNDSDLLLFSPINAPSTEKQIPTTTLTVAPANKEAAPFKRDSKRFSTLSHKSLEDRSTEEKQMFPVNPPVISDNTPHISEWSHQQAVPVAPKPAEKTAEDFFADDDWQEMPIITAHDIYDDTGRLIAKERLEDDTEDRDKAHAEYKKGYSRVNIDEDAKSTTSMDENTQYLFPDDPTDDGAKDPLSQMEATKDILTEGERVAYVGLCRLVLADMAKDLGRLDGSSSRSKKDLNVAREGMQMFTQKIMLRLYAHMDISPPEQMMVEQLAEHGVIAEDLTPALMKNTRVKNPMANKTSSEFDDDESLHSFTFDSNPAPTNGKAPEIHTSDIPDVHDPSEYSNAKTLDIDIRWTVLCDLFLVLIADSVYDARSRSMLEEVGLHLGIPWLDICRFEKRVTDALELQNNAQQNWTEEEHMENRRKQSKNRRYMMVGLATIGGSLIIGLSGGILAPAIGAGLALGLSTFGIAGTAGVLGSAAATGIIASGAVLSGGTVAARASLNRTQSVTTFEYRPLYNNKRVNLILTISGWMNGKEDDVRLPYSTVDPIMGDIYSVLWEPEMLQSTGKTMQILATEVLTQSLQQALGQTILVALMASVQVPMLLSKLAYLIDNPWNVSMDRAMDAGRILADSLVHRNLGARPVTLVGFSLGARVIYSCLRELSKLHAYGLVQNVYMFGTPVVVKRNDYLRCRSVVAGRFVNGYSTNDWILGYLFRATGGGLGKVAGLARVEDIPGVENVDCTELVDGHMAYRASIPRLLKKVGWIVLEDEFTEIEDPDPDKHRERQRELISELDEARNALAASAPNKKGRFSFFSRKKPAKPKNWEAYVDLDSSRREQEAKEAAHADDVLFDVEAIRKELADQKVQVKELETTLPSLQVSAARFEALRETTGRADIGQVVNEINTEAAKRGIDKKKKIKPPKRTSWEYSCSEEDLSDYEPDKANMASPIAAPTGPSTGPNPYKPTPLFPPTIPSRSSSRHAPAARPFPVPIPGSPPRAPKSTTSNSSLPRFEFESAEDEITLTFGSSSGALFTSSGAPITSAAEPHNPWSSPSPTPNLADPVRGREADRKGSYDLSADLGDFATALGRRKDGFASRSSSLYGPPAGQQLGLNNLGAVPRRGSADTGSAQGSSVGGGVRKKEGWGGYEDFGDQEVWGKEGEGRGAFAK